MIIDLFWEPMVGDHVRLRSQARIGVRPFDDHPLLVLRVAYEGGMHMFQCETTGPTEVRTTRTGRTVRSHPRWASWFVLADLVPLEAA